MPDTPIPNVNPALLAALQGVSPEKLEKSIKSRLVKDYKKRLNLQRLPNNINKLIGDAAKRAAMKATTVNVDAEAAKIAREFYKPSNVNALLTDKLGKAKLGVKLVTQSADLDEILVENAKLLRKKWKALVDAGFTQEQAFSLIQAEVEGKASRR